MNSEIGEVRETVNGSALVEWQIPDFFSLPTKDPDSQVSPVFYFSDACWFLRLCPGRKYESGGLMWVSLFLDRMDSGPGKDVSFTLGIKRRDGTVMNGLNNVSAKIITKTGVAWGHDKFFERNKLVDEKSELAPAGIVTVTCALKINHSSPTSTSLFSRVWRLSRDMKKRLDEGNDTDLVIKLENEELGAHRAILESRSDYFAGMLSQDFEENVSGEITIEGIDEDTFQSVLSYLYSGDADKMTERNVRQIYIAADRLLLQELKKLCSSYMIENLCPAFVCDALATAKMYEEKELMERATEYFNDNVSAVLKSGEWKKFKQENWELASELLENVIKSRLHLKA